MFFIYLIVSILYSNFNGSMTVLKHIGWQQTVDTIQAGIGNPDALALHGYFSHLKMWISLCFSLASLKCVWLGQFVTFKTSTGRFLWQYKPLLFVFFKSEIKVGVPKIDTQLEFTYDGAFWEKRVIFVTQNNALRDCFKLTTT